MTTWRFAANTSRGIFVGELEGVIEDGETNEQAMQACSNIVRSYLRELGVKNILSCIVSDGEQLVDAPDSVLVELNIEEEMKK